MLLGVAGGRPDTIRPVEAKKKTPLHLSATSGTPWQYAKPDQTAKKPLIPCRTPVETELRPYFVSGLASSARPQCNPFLLSDHPSHNCGGYLRPVSELALPPVTDLTQNRHLPRRPSRRWVFPADFYRNVFIMRWKWQVGILNRSSSPQGLANVMQALVYAYELKFWPRVAFR